jgi:hypothetical protein
MEPGGPTALKCSLTHAKQILRQLIWVHHRTRDLQLQYVLVRPQCCVELSLSWHKIALPRDAAEARRFIVGYTQSKSPLVTHYCKVSIFVLPQAGRLRAKTGSDVQ